MRLSSIRRTQNPILEFILSSTILNEKTNGPWWPVEWAENAFENPKFRQWMDKLGITGIPGSPMFGNVGRAYKIGENFIIKFTTDKKEASAAAVLKGHDSEHVAQVYDVIRVMTVSHPKLPNERVSLYAIAMEKLNTGIGKKMRLAANAVYSYLDDHSGFIEDPDASIKVVVGKYLKSSDVDVVRSVSQIVDALYDVQNRTGVLLQDPHGGNVALKKRKPAFFDFGRSNMNLDHPKSADARISSIQ